MEETMEPQNLESQSPELMRAWIQHLKLEFNTEMLSLHH